MYAIRSYYAKEIIQKNTIMLDEKGIIEDRHYDKDPMRSVLITSLHSYDIVTNMNISMDFGSLGENSYNFV